MSIELQACIETICKFPTLYKTANKNPVDLVKQSGYNELYNYVTIESIATYLRKHQDVVNSWVQFSDDIRHSPAWGFGQDNNNKWQVVYADNGHPVESFAFEDAVDACAKMIKETIETIRRHNN